MKKHITRGLILFMLIFLGCGGGQSSDSEKETKAQKTENGLTEFEQKHGIGPVTEVISLGEADRERIEKGKEIFKTKCSACHKVGEKYIGPDLAGVTDRRTPTYVMNMILNPDGMVKKHPEAKKMLSEYLSPMPNQNLERDEALAIVQYLDSVEPSQDAE